MRYASLIKPGTFGAKSKFLVKWAGLYLGIQHGAFVSCLLGVGEGKLH